MAATPSRAPGESGGRGGRCDGRQIRFRVAAWDEAEQIGAGTHERMVVDLERLGKRLVDKRPASASSV